MHKFYVCKARIVQFSRQFSKKQTHVVMQYCNLYLFQTWIHLNKCDKDNATTFDKNTCSRQHSIGLKQWNMLLYTVIFKKKSHGKEAEIVDPCAQQHSKQISIFSCKHVAILKEFVIRIYKKLQIQHRKSNGPQKFVKTEFYCTR